MTLQMQAFTYAQKKVPSGYHCDFCKKEGVKLWRDYQTFMDHQTLACAACALEKAKKSDGLGVVYEAPLTPEGLVRIHYVQEGKEPFGHHLGDSIGWRVPAVPTEDGTTFWGYSSVPPEGVSWWKQLPNG